MGQLTTAAFTAYNAANAGSIVAGPFALFTVSLDSLEPTQINEGYTEVDTKTAAFDEFSTLAAVETDLQADIEPVVIGPGGVLYLLDGHHTFTALANSIWGASNPTVYVNVIANYSGLTTSEFWSTMEANNLVLPLNNGVAETLNTATGAPLPTSLTTLISDPYRGLEYSILKNKSSTLFTTTSNITGATGATTPGLDKLTGFYADFIWAQAYQDAIGGLGLPYLSPGDIALATAWNLNINSTTVEPGVGTVKVGQLPGAILNQNIVISTTISNATLANGTLDAFGTFTGITSFTFGTTVLGTVQSGLVIQVGADKGFDVTLTGSNTYTGGTTMIAGTLVIGSDAALGAAAPSSYTINPSSVVASVEAANGIIFNSLTEGNAILTIGTSAGGGTATFTTNRPIAVDGETATLNPDGYIVTLTGQIASTGSDGDGLGNATGVSDFTVNDTSTGAKGVVIIAPTSGSNALFDGNWIISAGTLSVASDAALGNTTLPAVDLGQIELNGGIFQTSGSFTSSRALFLAGGSTFDTDGYTTSFGTLSDTQRTLTVINSSTTSAGAVTFNAFDAASTATLALTPGTKGLTVTLTNGFARSGAATVLISPTSGTLGSATLKVMATTAPTLIDGIVSPWIISDSGGSATTNPYNFITYGANGYVNATYSKTGGGTTGGIAVAGAGDVVDQTSSATLTANAQAYALNINNGVVVTLGTNTLTLGDGTDPAGLILQNAAISGGTLAFGGSEGVIWIKGSTGQTVSSVISGSGGLTFSGSGGVTLNAVSTESGAINVDSGTLTLGVANVFANDTAGLTLLDVKSKPSNAILTFSTNQSFSTLNSAGNNSAINFSGGAVLTIGDSNNESSTLSSAITETGTAVAGAIVKAGTGLVDLSGASTKGITLVAGSTIAVNGGQLRVTAKTLTNSTGFSVAAGAELQFEESGGDVYSGAITGAGDVRLISGTLKLTGTADSYSGGTFVETGATLDLTTANVSSGNANIGSAGGMIDFDQNTNGTYAGVISDARLMGTGAIESATLVKDDSTTDDAGTVTLTQAQTFSGSTYIEAGGLTLDAVNTLATSAGVVLGRIGGGATAVLTLGANNELAALSSDASNTTSVVLDGNVLTLAPSASAASSFGGVISDGSAPGSLVIDGAGTVTLTGANTYSGGTTLEAGTFELGNAAAAGTGAITFAAGDAATLKIDNGIAIANSVAGFAVGDTIDLAGLAFSGNGGASLGANGLLSVTENGTTAQIQLATGTSYAGDVVHLASDGNGGVDVTLTAAPTVTVNGNGAYVNAAGEADVAIAVTGLVAGDNGSITFTDGSGNTVVVAVTSGQTAYTANFSGLVDGPVFSTLTVAGEGYTATGNAVTLSTAIPAAPGGLADAAIANGTVNAAADTAAQALTGTATAGDTVTIYDNGTALGTTTADSSGAWSYTLGALGNGSHSLTATDTDVAGNAGAPSSALTFTVDSVIPAAPSGLADAAIANGYVNAATNTAAQALTGTATAGDTVTVYDNGAVLGTTTATGTGTWSFTLGVLGTGSHSLTATQTDAVGNVSAASSALALTVDTTIPAPPAGLTDAAAVNGLINVAGDTAVQALTGTGVAGETVTVYDNGAKLGTATVAGNGTWSYTVGTLANGSHSLTATQTDPAGNVSAVSSALALTVDTAVPAAPTTLTDGAVVGGYVNAAHDTAAQTLTGKAAVGNAVTIYENGTEIGTTTVLANGAWSFALGDLANGSYSLTATDTNSVGNTSVASAALAFVVDTTIPAAPTGLADAGMIGNLVPLSADTATQRVTGKAAAGTTITVYDNGVKLGTTRTSAAGTWSFTLGALALHSTNSLTATATDPAGNVSGLSSALAFEVVNTVPSIPTRLADTAIRTGVVNAVRDLATQALTGRGPDSDTITIFDNGTEIGTTTSTASGTWSYALGVLATGDHSLTATAADAFGDVSAASAPLSFAVEATLPVPVITSETVPSGTATIVLGGTSADLGATITIKDGSTVVGTATVGTNGIWSDTVTVAPDVKSKLIATGTDSYGNTGAAAAAVIFDATPDSTFAVGAGAAIVVGLSGDTISAGTGPDTFVFHAGFGDQTISNFVTGGASADSLQFDSSLFANWAHLLAATKQVGTSLEITLDASDVITLKNVTLSSFTSTNAHFV